MAASDMDDEHLQRRTTWRSQQDKNSLRFAIANASGGSAIDLSGLLAYSFCSVITGNQLHQNGATVGTI
jgi:hypothetical protein